jgi:hypothetical protein
MYAFKTDFGKFLLSLVANRKSKFHQQEGNATDWSSRRKFRRRRRLDGFVGFTNGLERHWLCHVHRPRLAGRSALEKYRILQTAGYVVEAFKFFGQKF